MAQPVLRASETPAAQRGSRRIARVAKAVCLSFAAALAAGGPATLSEVTVYSYREPQRIEPLLRAFHGTTGIRVKMVYARDGLIDRIEAEGTASPADVLLTNEFGLLLDARVRGLTHAFKSAAVEANVPAIYRDPEGHWFGLTRRARLFVVSAQRVDSSAMTYEDLVQPRWKGKICIRPGKHAYNVSLIASMLAHRGRIRQKPGCRG